MLQEIDKQAEGGEQAERVASAPEILNNVCLQRLFLRDNRRSKQKPKGHQAASPPGQWPVELGIEAVANMWAQESSATERGSQCKQGGKEKSHRMRVCFPVVPPVGSIRALCGHFCKAVN